MFLQVPPINWLTFESGWIIHPLRSRRITVFHRYYGVVRPCAPHRYSHSCGSSTVDAVIVASLRQLDVKLAQQRPLAMPDSEFMGLELLYVGHWSSRNRLKGFRLKAEGRAINQFRMVHGSAVERQAEGR